MKGTTIQKWGNSYAVRLPKDAVRRMRLMQGQAVSVRETKDGKTLELVPALEKTATLETLLARISKHNRPERVAWGEPAGKEVW